MNTRKALAAAILALATGVLNVQAQYEFRFLFQGTCYQTNGTGNIVGTPITEQTLLQDRAQVGGVTDLSTIALVYHVGGDSKGDTVEVVSTNGSTLALEFGFWFGDDPSLLRTGLTNATRTEELRIDYIYTLDSATYLSPNSHSMGCAFTRKQYTSGHVPTAIFGPIQWIVNPYPNSSTKVITGTFRLGAPFP